MNEEHHITLNEDDFRLLVRGQEVDRSGVKLILADIGWGPMFDALNHAVGLSQWDVECEFCDNIGSPFLYSLETHPSAAWVALKTDDYTACPNCLLALVTLSLTPQQFLRARERGGDPQRFYLHDDFYDHDTGEALQPKLPGLPHR